MNIFFSKVVVIGAGYIAVELAGILGVLGSETHLLIRQNKVFTYRSFCHSFSHSFIHSLISSFIHSFVISFLESFIYFLSYPEGIENL